MKNWKVRYSYLPQQFKKIDHIITRVKNVVQKGDFTLGKELTIFEKRFASLIGTKYAVGVNSGTDAIKISLKAVGVKHGDEVITAANTFVATVGGICELGAKPVFVDVKENYCLDADLLEAKINKKTKAILPVHFTGYTPDMKKIMAISKKYKIPVIEDACQGILSSFNKKNSGTWGITGCFSLHPLKNLNVWSDGGIITTNNKKIYQKLKLLRNHGLINRDEFTINGYNSRLDTIQAAVGNCLINDVKILTKKRIKNASYYDKEFSKIKQLSIPKRYKENKNVFHLYVIFAKKRNQLLKYCLKKGIECKIHYPKELYLQKGLKFLKHKKGDFPVTDWQCKNIISFPVDQYLSKNQLSYVVKTVQNFYNSK
tara:strand:- start:222 stop:1334 length:1113 start_codon:yes stop_codon:yes gene_type:complete